ncbi:hypothetical protein H4217_004161 [Coemansia sp. RSA 1939]|nr:hypothetical protein H4217_004161 [Coemansia sp. RSA 1939]KAJ2610347.1 hypothetical protein EV177_004019 [Coemansia sp. RSA 1804]KAJ2693931.1 hypothetical protein GGH99_000922 [Coemansia sp. RSA 1285]
MASSTVRVALRIRPLSPREHINGETECVTQLPGVPQIVIGADRAFTFDYVFSPEVSQEQVYNDAIRPLVTQFLQGQTGSGKTFSMGTGLAVSDSNMDMQGVVPHAIREIWQHLAEKSAKHGGFTYSVDVSFLELYNEDLIDLLNPRMASSGNNGGGSGGAARGPTIREDSRGNMVLVGVERKAANCEADITGYLHQGALSRTTASTDMNRTSSRSHAIFTIYLRQQERRASAAYMGNHQPSPPLSEPQTLELDNGPSIVSKIHFVDLAGSERIKRTGAAGNRAKEGISINAGLLALGNVISALGGAVSNGNPSSATGTAKRATHVPYRDSKLTRLLQDSLGGNSQTAMLACISPSDKNSNESLNTIRYANRARNIRNKVAVNFDKNSSVELNMLKTEVARLRGELSNLKLLRRQSSIPPADQAGLDSGSARHIYEIMQLQAKNSDLVQHLEKALRRVAVLEKERDSLRSQVTEFGGSVQSTPQFVASKLPDSESMSTSTTPTSQLEDGDLMMSRSNMLETLDRELTEQAERHEHQINSVRRHYESKLELVQESLAVVQRERDAALDYLAKSKKSGTSAVSVAAVSANGASGVGMHPQNRKTLGLDSGVPGMAPTKLRLPSRVSKGPADSNSSALATVTPKKSSIDLRGARRSSVSNSRPGSILGISSPSNVAGGDGNAAHASQHSGQNPLRTKELEDEIRRLKAENKQIKEHASTDADRLALQIQDQAREISRLRRQRTGRKGSQRYSLLAFKENSWAAAKTATSQADGQDTNGGPNLLRAAFIKAVIEHELQRCIQARQLLRERDSYLTKQDELMNEQNDLLLCIQNIDLETDDEGGSAQMQRATDRIEIIDAELHYLDLKVRDTEAEVAQLAEAATAAGSGCQCASAGLCTCDGASTNSSGILGTPAIINMSGLAMRMVEDVVRIDYSAFSSLFQSLSAKDSTGLSYLLMQDIIELRLLAYHDKRDKAFLEEQTMDLRRTLIAMQKTALNAALTYERELGDAERRLVQMNSPHQSSFTPPEAELDDHFQHISNDVVVSKPHFDSNTSSEIRIPTVPSFERLPSDRSVYDGVRERGILLRSALMGAADTEMAPASCSSTPPRMVSAGMDSMEDIRGAKAPIVELSDDVSDFGSLRINSLRGYRIMNPSLASTNVAAIMEIPESRDEDTDSDYADTADMMGPVDQVQTAQHVTRSTGREPIAASPIDVDSMSYVAASSSSKAISAAYNAIESPLNKAGSPIESDASYLGNGAESGGAGDFAAESHSEMLSEAGVGGYEPNDADNGEEVYLSNPEMSGSETDEVVEIYRSGSGEFFRMPNFARDPSISSQSNHRSFRPTHRRSSRRHIVRRMSIRKPTAKLSGKYTMGANSSSGNKLGTRGKDKRRVSLRKTRIGMPIVPPEMVDYIDKCNPTAINVGVAGPIIGSPEVLQRMDIQQTNEYHDNIALFASFALEKRQQTVPGNHPSGVAPVGSEDIKEPTTAGNAPLDAIYGGAEETDNGATGNSRPSVGHNFFIPRSAGKIRSRVSVDKSAMPDCCDTPPPIGTAGAVPLLTDAYYNNPGVHAGDDHGNIESPTSVATETTLQSQTRSPTLFGQNNSPFSNHGAPVSAPVASAASAGNCPSSPLPDDTSKAPPQDIRAMLAVPVNGYLETGSPMVFGYGQGGGSHTKGIIHLQKSAFEAYERLSPPEPKHRYLSPTEKANASLFSMLDAAKTSVVKFDETAIASKEDVSGRRHSRAHVHASSDPAVDATTPERSSQAFESPYSSHRNSSQMHDSPLQGLLEGKLLSKGTRSSTSKPGRIRRRALTEYGDDIIIDTTTGDNAVASATKGDSKQQQSGGGSRLSKLLSGIGFNRNSKQQNQQQGDGNGNGGRGGSPLPRRPHSSSKPSGVGSSTTVSGGGSGRDRSSSDSAGTRKTRPMRKVHSVIDGVVTERRRDKWLMANDGPDFVAAAFTNIGSAEDGLADSNNANRSRSRDRSRMEVPFITPPTKKDYRFYSRRQSTGTTESICN